MEDRIPCAPSYSSNGSIPEETVSGTAHLALTLEGKMSWKAEMVMKEGFTVALAHSAVALGWLPHPVGCGWETR